MPRARLELELSDKQIKKLIAVVDKMEIDKQDVLNDFVKDKLDQYLDEKIKQV